MWAHLIESHWQQPKAWLTILLYPLSRIFGLISSLRRLLYRLNYCQSQQLPVPVVVIGNIHAGGTGKTPITVALCQQLTAQGIKVGVISRGYGRQNNNTLIVDPDGNADDYGDEPLMIARLTGTIVAVSSKRIDAAKLLLETVSDIQLIISDDGLQHYALKRDLEIVVFPQQDIDRNLDVLPNGPLREPLSRLNSIDALIISTAEVFHTDNPESLSCFINQVMEKYQLSSTLPQNKPPYISYLQTQTIYKLHHPEQTIATDYFQDKKISAICAIARPQRFFNTLTHLGIKPDETIILPDHAHIQQQDIPQSAEYVITTQKDEVKLKHINVDKVWILAICAIIKPDLMPLISNLIKKP